MTDKPSKLEQIRALGQSEIARRYVPDDIRRELKRANTRASTTHTIGGKKRKVQPKPISLAKRP